MRTAAIVLLCLSLLPAAASAADKRPDLDDLVLATASDEEVRSRLAEVLPLAAEQIEEFGSDAALAYTQRVYDTKSYSYRFVYNLVWWVKEGEAEDLVNFLRYFPPSREIEEASAFVIRPGEFSVEAALAAPVERLGPDRITIRRGGGKDMETSVVVAFETAGPGDVIAVSVKGRSPRRLYWRTWFLADEHPVSRADLRLFCSPENVYILFGQDFAPGQVEQDVVRDDTGLARQVTMRARGIAPYRDEQYGLPRREQSPSLRLAWRAAKGTPDGQHMVWFRYEKWNQVASLMATYERYSLEKDKQARKLARSLTDGLAREAAADTLFLFARDQLQNIAVNSFRDMDRWPTVDDVLKVRAGLVDERAYLLAAMLRAIEIPAEIVWAHDPDDGTLFDEYPSWGQMDVPLVKAVVDGRERWYDLDCRGCTPGTLRPALRGGPAMTYKEDADELEDDIVDGLIADAWGRHLDFFDLYIRTIAFEPWHSMITLPGDAAAGVGMYTERVAWDGQVGGTADVRATGFMPLRGALAEAEQPRDVVDKWFRGRYESARSDSVLAVETAPGDTVHARVAFAADLPPAQGDTWIIPAGVLMGRPHVAAWRAGRTSPLHIAQGREYVWEVSVPLPEGWTDVEVPAPHKHGSRSLSYEALFRTRDGHLILRRHLVEKPVTVRDPQSLQFIGREIDKINVFESAPIVLQRKGQGS